MSNLKELILVWDLEQEKIVNKVTRLEDHRLLIVN